MRATPGAHNIIHVEKSKVMSSRSRNASTAPGSFDARSSVSLSRASDGSSRLVHKRESSASEDGLAGSHNKLSVDTLSEAAVDTSILARSTRGVGIEGGEFGVESLCVFSILKAETSTGRSGCASHDFVGGSGRR